MRKVIFLLALGFSYCLNGQTDNAFSVKIRVDTAIYNWNENTIEVDGQEHLYFYFENNKTVCDVYIMPKKDFKSFSVLPSKDYEFMDTLLFINGAYRFKVRFESINRTNFYRFTLAYKTDSDSAEVLKDIPLLPLTYSSASIRPSDNDIYIGEERSFNILTNTQSNLRVSNEWVTTEDYEYRFSREENRVYLHLIPKKLGRLNISIPITARKPYLDEESHTLVYDLEPINYTFKVKSSRLRFLQLDKQELTLNDETRLDGIEVQLENYRTLELNKTYRIENQEEAGGPLIAEIFTKQLLTNNKVLCILRPFNYHKTSSGYLYIKSGDTPKFISNFNITPETNIEKISILAEGREWRVGNTIKPGEVVDVKFEGEGLHKADFYFEDLIDISKDTLIRNENEIIFKLQVPISITKKKLNIYNHGVSTGKSLIVKEYHRPRDFDYIYVDYGDLARQVSAIRGPILYENTLKDVSLNFNRNHIDREQLHGIQHLTIDVVVNNKRNDLVEMRTIKNVAVCPSHPSPREDYYSDRNCNSNNINLNDYLKKKTYNLDDWSKINITVRNDELKYNENGYEKELEIILKRKMSFDIEVSFPAGLLTVAGAKEGDDKNEIQSLSGISMAMIAQFSFYHPDKIARYRPYKIGAGFLALNAFNFTDDANRDVGMVVLGSIYPATREVKLSFPLYVGFGYFFKEERLKFIIGPGIRVKL